MIIDSATLDPTSAYKLLIGCITPRAIGWISTLSKDGVANLAPISFFQWTMHILMGLFVMAAIWQSGIFATLSLPGVFR